MDGRQLSRICLISIREAPTPCFKTIDAEARLLETQENAHLYTLTDSFWRECTRVYHSACKLVFGIFAYVNRPSGNRIGVDIEDGRILIWWSHLSARDVRIVTLPPRRDGIVIWCPVSANWRDTQRFL